MTTVPWVVRLDRVPSPPLRSLWSAVRARAAGIAHVRGRLPHSAPQCRAERETSRRLPSPTLRLLWRHVYAPTDRSAHVRGRLSCSAQPGRAECQALRVLPPPSMPRVWRAVHPSEDRQLGVLAALSEHRVMGRGSGGRHRGPAAPSVRVVRGRHHGPTDRCRDVLAVVSGADASGALARCAGDPPANARCRPASRRARLRRPPARVAAHSPPCPRSLLLLRCARAIDDGSCRAVGAWRSTLHRQCRGRVRSMQFVQERSFPRRMDACIVGKNPIGKG